MMQRQSRMARAVRASSLTSKQADQLLCRNPRAVHLHLAGEGFCARCQFQRQRAERERYVRIVVGQGAPMTALLSSLQAGAGQMQRYIDQLLAVFREELRQTQATDWRPSSLTPHSLVAALTERELEVLGLLAAGRSNRAIGQAPAIEVGTVKRHVHNLFGKLAVQSRSAIIGAPMISVFSSAARL